MPIERQSRIEGADIAAKLLKQLPQDISKRVIASSTRKGAKILLEEIKERAPEGDQSEYSQTKIKERQRYGSIKDNIKISTVYRAADTIILAVHTGNAYWAMFREFGTRLMSKIPFIRPAFDSKKDQVIDVISTDLGKKIEREVEKLGRGYKKKKRL